MDTSETYIKMSDCPEIQQSWQIADWDYCYCEKSQEVVVLSGYETDAGCYGHGIGGSMLKVEIIGTWKDNGGCGSEGRHIWLPRQDQLQEMMGEGRDLITMALVFLPSFVQVAGYKKFTSMEQVWLCFVMKEKYNKVWSNGEWESSPKDFLKAKDGT